MRRVIIFAAFLSMAVWAGCSKESGDSDSPTGPGPSGPPRVQANNAVGAPAMDSANEPIWNGVTKYAVDLSSSNSPKLPVPQSQNAPDSVYVQAITDGTDLYLRIEYTDDSLNLLKDFLQTINPNATFAVQDYSQEDQIFVMFAGLPNNDYDVWNWRSLTTAPAGLGEGLVYDNTLDTLFPDNGNQVVALNNFDANSVRPRYVHTTGASYTGQILYQDDIDPFANHQAEYLDSIGLVVPGYYIDSATGTRVKQPAFAQSRWDIFAVHSYNSSTNRLAVVMQCKLNTTYPDDLVLSDSVKIKIGVLDDQKDLEQPASSRRGFTEEFWLIL